MRYFDGARPPAPRKGTGSWAPSSVRKILTNERYTGKIPFGRHRKAYRKGTKTRLKQNGDVYVAERPDLRIVPEALWAEVVTRFTSARKTYLRDTNGNLWGRPGMGVESKYLLTGLARCSCCGANMKATSRRSGSPPKRHIIRYYECSFWANRGTTVCANNRRVHMDVADRTVLDAIEHTVLTPKAIDYVVERAVRVIAERRAERPDALATLQADIRRDGRRIENLVKAISRGDAPQTLVAEIRRLEEDRAAVRPN